MATIDAATFRATLPTTLSAIRMAGDGGMRIMLDIAESDLAEAIKLLAWRQMVLSVTVEAEKQAHTDYAKNEHNMAPGTKRKSCWQAAKESSADGDPGQARQPDAS